MKNVEGNLVVTHRALIAVLSVFITLLISGVGAAVQGTRLLESIDRRIARIEDSPYQWQRHQMQRWSHDAEKINDGWRAPDAWSGRYDTTRDGRLSSPGQRP